MRMLASVVLIGWSVAGGLGPLEARGQEVSWPQWRGPKRDAVSTETGLLKEWPEGGPALAWKSAGLGRGYSSVVISGGKIFTGGKLENGEHLLALSLQDGALLWKTRLGDGSGEGPSSTPTVDGDLVYAVSSTGDLVCAKVADGAEVFRKSYTADYKGSVPTWHYCDSVLIDGDRLICTPGSAEATVVAINKKTGAELWRSAIPNGGGSGFGYASPVISEAGGVRQYVQLLGAGTGIVGIRATDGKLLWQYAKVANGTASIPTPIVMGDLVFCSSGYGTGSALLKLQRDGDGVKAEEQYFLKANVLENHHGGMVRVGDFVYCGHKHNEGFPICVEIKSGKPAWGGNMRGPGSGSAAVVYADGRLYFRYQNGLMALIDASTEGYSLKGTFTIPETGGPSWSHPVVAGGKLYLREQNNLFVYDVKAK